MAAWLSAPAPRAWQSIHLLEPIRREGVLAAPLSTEAEWRAMLEEAHFTGVSIELVGHQVRRTWTLIALDVLRELTGRRGWAYLLGSTRRHRRFAFTVFRLWLAYRVGAMDYGVIVAWKGDRPRHASEPASASRTQEARAFTQ